ncbi:MAG: hypothetical protein ABIT69_01160 [Sphingomicrobium sp.]
MIGTVAKSLVGASAALAMAAAPVAAAAQATPAPVPVTLLQTPDQALAQDGAAYAQRFGVSEAEAVARLRALQASAAFTERLRESLKERLVGISIDHQPGLRIVVLLTGDTPVADTSIDAAGMALPVVFRTGAAATGDDVIRAMLQRQTALNALLPRARGMGLDARSGELVVLIAAADAARRDIERVRRQAEALTGVKVRFDLADRPSGNLSLGGGGRIVGTKEDGKRYACTTAFAVTDGVRTGIATAAHCPDEVEYQDSDGARIALPFAGQWGARAQDVQINLTPVRPKPFFYADRKQGALRVLSGARSRLSTRAGEWLCHYGESSGYSCAEVELTQFAPPGDLCAGPCAPSWVTVRTHDCHGGDSGGPVFSGTVAFGITKGGSGGRDTRCNFYFYMSTDYLPAGWKLLR